MRFFGLLRSLPFYSFLFLSFLEAPFGAIFLSLSEWVRLRVRPARGNVIVGIFFFLKLFGEVKEV